MVDKNNIYNHSQNRGFPSLEITLYFGFLMNSHIQMVTLMVIIREGRGVGFSGVVSSQGISFIRHCVNLKRAQERAIWVFHRVLYDFLRSSRQCPWTSAVSLTESENPLEAAVLLVNVRFLC